MGVRCSGIGRPAAGTKQSPRRGYSRKGRDLPCPPIVTPSGLALRGYGALWRGGGQASRTIPVIMTGRKCFRRFALRSHGCSVTGLAGAPGEAASWPPGSPARVRCLSGPAAARAGGRPVRGRPCGRPVRGGSCGRGRAGEACRPGPYRGSPSLPRSRPDGCEAERANIYRTYTLSWHRKSKLIDIMFA
jgi:hypothetical protein